MQKKTEMLCFRTNKAFKDLLRKAARQNNRSMSNMFEVLIIEYCLSHKIALTKGDLNNDANE